MRYHSLNLMCFVIFTLFGIVSIAYAEPAQLQFDPSTFVIEHTSVITCLNCSSTNDILPVDVTDDVTGTKTTFNLNRILGTSNFESDPIKFTTSSTGASNEFITDLGNLDSKPVSVATSDGSSAHAQIKKNFTNLSDVGGNSYSAGAKTIKKLVLGCVTSNPNIGADDDGDGICNSWEDPSTFNLNSACNGGNGLCVRTSNTSSVYRLDCDSTKTTWNNLCPDKNKADIYYEIDFMTGHKPKTSAIDSVFTSFEQSGFDGKQIALHVQLDEEITHTNRISTTGTTTDPGFDQMKGFWFGTLSDRGGIINTFPNQIITSPWYTSGGTRDLKSIVFHYMIFAHSLSTCAETNCSSGFSEVPGNDGIVALGSFYNMIGTLDQQEGTLMHEIGHDVNLYHGGNENKNCKPNYISVMSYSRQFSDLVSDRKLDFSRSATLMSIPESNLPTANDLGSYDPAFEQRIVFATPSGLEYWNTGSGTSVPWGINAFSVNNIPRAGCDDTTLDTLNSFKDWDKARLKLTARTSSTWWD